MASKFQVFEDMIAVVGAGRVASAAETETVGESLNLDGCRIRVATPAPRLRPFSPHRLRPNPPSPPPPPARRQSKHRSRRVASMYIQVKQNKTTYFIQCDPTKTILNIKQKLQSIIDHPPNNQRLILLATNNILDDSKTQADPKRVINPYHTEVLQHPQTMEMHEGVLHICDVKGPKKTGSMETRMEAMEQDLFKCQGMEEQGLNANHLMITEFTHEQKLDAKDLCDHVFKIYEKSK
ncbi:40S ribosomal protein S5-1 [Hordeum vulgare]|nr:40S ribosomal protein S5-1 [Hordeum vulgare]